MRLAHYALLDLSRRPGRAFAVSLLLTVSILAMVGTLAYARAVEHRLAYIEDQGLREVAVVQNLRLTAEQPVPFMEELPGPGVVAEPLILGFAEQDARARDLLYEVLREQPGVDAVGYATDGRLRTRRVAAQARFYDVRFINRDFVNLLPLTMVEGRWFEPADWRGNGTMQRPLPVVVSTHTPGRFQVGDVVGLWRGPVATAEQLFFRVVGTFERRDNYFLETPVGSMGFHDVLQVPSFHFIAPDVIVNPSPSAFLVRLQEERLSTERWFAWRDAIALRAHEQGFRVGGRSYVQPLAEVFDAYLAQMAPRDRFATWLAAMVLALTTFGFGSLSALSVWDRRREWGIHLAQGARRHDLLLLACWELAWLSVVPALVAGALMWGHAMGTPADGTASYLLPATLNHLRLDATTVSMGVALIGLIGLAAALVPVVYLKTRTPVELVRQVT